MRIGILSDTHGHTQNTQAAAQVFERHNVELVIHCGDIGSTAIPALLAKWPTHFVWGNVDHDTKMLRAAIAAAGHTCHDEFGALEVEEKKISFLHSHDAKRFRATIAAAEWDLVCYGHTHQAESHRVGRTWVLNPGAVFRATPHSVAIVDLPSMRIAIETF